MCLSDHLPVFPVINETLFLPDVIDFNMQSNPNQPFYIFADTNCATSIQVITHLEFSRAAHRVAHALRPGRTGCDGEVVGILAETDIVLYQAIVAGLTVAGLVPFPISPRNPPGVIAELLLKTSCHRLFTTSVALHTLLDKTRACLTALSHEVLISEIPALAAIYPHLAHEVVEHPFERYMGSPLRPSPSDICVILHSSGSTGTPKAIAQTHLFWIQIMIHSELKEYVPRLVLGSMSLPPFHFFGIGIQLFMPAYGVMPAAVFPPTSTNSGRIPFVPSPQNVLEHTKLTKTNALFTVPAFITVWSTSASAIDCVKQLEFLGYGGGPLPQKIGNDLAINGVRLNLIYGGTDFGVPACLVPTEDVMDWEYTRFYKHTTVRWMPQGDGTFECQLLACETHRPVVYNLGDVEGYATADIFEPHPVKEGLWKSVGRLDEVILHSSGEKTIPGPMEGIIMSNHLVQAAILFGRERDHPGALIELKSDVKIDLDDQAVGLARLRNCLLPTIEEANSKVPAFSKVFKEMLLFTSKEKPLPRTPKGTVMRKAAYDLYSSEISALYENVDLTITNHSGPISWDIAGAESWLVEQVAELTSGKVVSSVTDLFDEGFDSLSATILRRRITNAMRSSDDPLLQEASRNIDQNLIYNARTIKNLAYHATSIDAVHASQLSQGVDAIESLVAKYSRNFVPLSPDSSNSVSNQEISKTVLLTGSTGHLGSQILAILLTDSHVNKVYAFNRSTQATSALDRQTERFKDIGLDLALLNSPKLILVTGDSTHSDLGIEKELYSEICSSINVVIHNAWRVDFNLPLPSYEPNIQSTRNFIDLVRASPTPSKVRFLFISSIASVQSWDNCHGPVPEEIVGDVSHARGRGYGEGKYVVERMLAMSNLSATALRLGQVCGGRPKGSWPTSEWVPMIVKSSVTLGVFPDMDGIASWLFADAAAHAIIDIALSPLQILPPVLNLVHPRPVEQRIAFNGIYKAIKDVLNLDLQLVPFIQWISILRERDNKATSKNDLKTIPAIKLIDFFDRSSEQTNRTFSTEKIQSISGALLPESLSQIGRNDGQMWVQYWYSAGYLN